MAASLTYLIIASVCVAAAMIILLVRMTLIGRRADDRAEIRSLRERLSELTAERDEARTRAETLGIEVADLRGQVAVADERLAWLGNAEKTLRETFESLASRTLQESARVLTDQSKTHLDQFGRVLKADWGAHKEELSGLVRPLSTELRKLDTQVRALEEKRQGAYQGIADQIQLISQQYRSLHQATTSLDQALRAPNVRGKWGEVQLRRLVELAGMNEHVDFDEQAVGTATAGDAIRRRPDLVVRLPSDGVLPVDAKAPMSAYLESQEAPTPELSRQALKRHGAALRSHIQSLASKAYWAQFDRAPEFVALLVPYESGLSAAFTVDPDLLEYALAHRVVVVAPASFLALLRVVAYGWMHMRLSENAQAISSAGRELLERLGPFADHLNRLGGSLTQAVERFNEAAGSFERRILPTARKLHELGAASGPPPHIAGIEGRSRRVASHDE